MWLKLPKTLLFQGAKTTLRSKAILGLTIGVVALAASCGSDDNGTSKSEVKNAVTDGSLSMTMIALNTDNERIKLLPLVCKADAAINSKEDLLDTKKCIPGVVDQDQQVVSLDMHFAEFKETFGFRGDLKSNTVRSYAALPTFLGALGGLEITRRSVKRQNRLGWTQSYKRYIKLPSIFMVTGTIIGGLATFQVITAPARTAGQYDRAIANHWEDLFEKPKNADQAVQDFAEAEKVEARSLMGNMTTVSVLRLLDRIIQDYKLVQINPRISKLDASSASEIKWLNRSQKKVEKK